MDLIDRQAIHDTVIARYPDSDDTQYNIGYADAINDVLKDIRYMPSAQKTGKWIREVLGSTSGYGTTVMYQCTNCEKMSISKYKFCPNCGARMIGEEE